MAGYLQCHIVYENMQMSKYIYLCIVSWLGINYLIRPFNQISCLFPCNSALQLISLVINKANCNDLKRFMCYMQYLQQHFMQETFQIIGGGGQEQYLHIPCSINLAQIYKKKLQISFLVYVAYKIFFNMK